MIFILISVRERLTCKKAIKTVFEAGMHLEVTLLLIPGRNDSDEDVRSLAQFIASISKDIPLHISAYRPAYLTIYLQLSLKM